MQPSSSNPRLNRGEVQAPQPSMEQLLAYLRSKPIAAPLVVWAGDYQRKLSEVGVLEFFGAGSSDGPAAAQDSAAQRGMGSSRNSSGGMGGGGGRSCEQSGWGDAGVAAAEAHAVATAAAARTAACLVWAGGEGKGRSRAALPPGTTIGQLLLSAWGQGEVGQSRTQGLVTCTLSVLPQLALACVAAAGSMGMIWPMRSRG
jgi:hypothetical protein